MTTLAFTETEIMQVADENGFSSHGESHLIENGGSTCGTSSPVPDTNGMNAAACTEAGLKVGESLPQEEQDTVEESSLQDSAQPKPRICYSRSELIKLQDTSASKKWPDIFDSSLHTPNRRLDPEKLARFYQDNRSDAPNSSVSVNSSKSVSNSGVTKHGAVKLVGSKMERPPDVELKSKRDPRERVKQEEQDGIILSPQRRSFGTGCHGLSQSCSGLGVRGIRLDASAERPARESHRDVPTRRIGSGRFVRREESNSSDRTNGTRRERDERSHDRPHEQQRRDWCSKTDPRYDREERYESHRRYFMEEETEKSERRERDRRYDRRRIGNSNKETGSSVEEETPEWFTEGPTSKSECIELMGFEEMNDRNSKPPTPEMQEKYGSHPGSGGGSRKSSRSNTPAIFEEKVITPSVHIASPEVCEKEECSPAEEHTENLMPEEKDGLLFNIDDFLEDIIGFHGDDCGEGGGSSKLKKFFSQQNSDPAFADSSSCQPSPTPWLNAAHYFTPISPVDKTNSPSVVDLFQNARGNADGQNMPPTFKDLLLDGKGCILEDIEANLRKFKPVQSQGGVPLLSQTGPQSAGPQAFPGYGVPQNSRTAFSDFLSKMPLNQGVDGHHRLSREIGTEDDILLKLLSGGVKEPIKGHIVNRQPLPMQKGPGNDSFSMLMKGNNCATTGIPPAATHVSNNNMSVNSGVSVPMWSLPPPAISAPSMVPHPRSPVHHPNNDLIRMLHSQQQNTHMHQHKKLHPQGMHQQPPANQHFDPIKQLVSGVASLSVNPGHQDFREALARPEVQALLNRVSSGQVTEAQLLSQLVNPNLNPLQRENIAVVYRILKTRTQLNGPTPRTTLTPSPTPPGIGATLPLGSTPVSLSPRVASPNMDGPNMLGPHTIPQSRISPLMFGGGVIPGTGIRRPPSHQELVAHTQNIMQNALIKQELEKAREKHRKREAEQAKSSNPAASQSCNLSATANNRSLQDISPAKNIVKSQSPLVFTPTSVMRKMTADKGPLDRSRKIGSIQISENSHEMEKKDPSIPVVNYTCPPPSLPLQTTSLGNPGHKDTRRLEVSNNSVLGPKSQMVMSGHNPSIGVHKPGMHMPNSAALNMVPQGMNMPPPQRPHVQNMQPPNSMRHFHQSTMRAYQNAFCQQVMRGPHPVMNSMPHASGSQMSFQHLPNSQSVTVSQQLPLTTSKCNSNYIAAIKNDGLQTLVTSGSSSQRISPVSFVQLFGRDLMTKVPGGKLPDLPGGKVLSLEEVERLQQTQPVPN